MVCELDVRWEGWSHEQIDKRVRGGGGAAVTERLEARLTDVATALDDISDRLNSTLRRVDGGEWTGASAAAAAEAMRVLRDFDDIMGHHGKVNSLAAYGQSDNAAWVRANVPPYVEVPVTQAPTGNPLDAFNATVDHEKLVQAAKNAEERARQVMREYETMTTARIAALPPLSPAPRVVLSTGDDTPLPIGEPGNGPGSGSADSSLVTPSGDQPGNSSPGGQPSGDPVAPLPPVGKARIPVGPTDDADVLPSPSTPAASAPPVRTPAATTGNATRAAAFGAPDAVPGPVTGSPDSERAADARPGGGAHPGGPGAHPGTGSHRTAGRGGITDILGHPTRGAHLGAVPPGTRPEDDKERQTRYLVPGSEIFEPDLLHDPFRPGSYVAPSSIGGDEDA